MAKTLAQIQKQIEALQKEANDIKSKEAPGVVSRIKEAIRHYGLTAADLGFASTAGKTKAKGAAAKYSDGAGNVWGGRGPRPAWLKEALAKGKTLDDFKAGASAQGVNTVGKGPKAKPTAKKPVAKYADGNGKTWSGRGPKPGWVKAALAQGKQMSDLLTK